MNPIVEKILKEKGGIKTKMLDNGLEPKKNNLIPGPHRFPMSRDFKQTMQCDNTVCPYHDRGRHCSSPSKVKIGAGGLCVPYQEWLTKFMGGE